MKAYPAGTPGKLLDPLRGVARSPRAAWLHGGDRQIPVQVRTGMALVPPQTLAQERLVPADAILRGEVDLRPPRSMGQPTAGQA
ncbi:hypothetical protein [Micromonospora profundi]|uniref:hypothetical protein n=1 Tax=Micromonospora profundi TaxID=1420889 RepID=UPI003659B157